MTDDLLRQLARHADGIGQAIVAERVGIRLPYAQRLLNPILLAASPAIAGDFPQSRTVVLLAFLATVYVNGANNATNYWTVNLLDTALATLATFNTSASAATTFVRLAASSLTQPGATNAALIVQAVATLNPGTLYLFPEVVVA